MKIIGWRKWSLQVLGLVSFTWILLRVANLDPLALGIGICMVLAPGMAANAYVHAKGKQPEN